ncbi:Hypothetical predicted protein [Lecanosticta acicola]|uniref:Uncharacterized protein n=1 Tax=Lecanosticta acicola TaxID=111012 RepID=A0AAI8W1U9_9PEZI|nr:Hypothetical predicted protein [Lecanosticta acicola]
MPRAKSNKKAKPRKSDSYKKTQKDKGPARTARDFTPLDEKEVFPFTELPAELRNKIYFYHLASNTRYNFASIRVPAICQASQQLREESLPILFAARAWYVTIGSNLQDRFKLRTGDEGLRKKMEESEECSTRLKDSGVTKMKKGSRKLLSYAAGLKDILIRNITFCIVEVESLNEAIKLDAAGKNHEWNALIVTRMTAKWVNDGSADVTILRGQHHPSNDVSCNFDAEDIDTAIKDAKEATETCGKTTKDFKGFGLSDLQKMGDPFRYSIQDMEQVLLQNSYKCFYNCMQKGKKLQMFGGSNAAFEAHKGQGTRFKGRKQRQ